MRGAVPVAAVGGLAVSLAGVGSYQVATAHSPSPLQQVKGATARFHSAAQAEQAGYVELRDAAGIACIDSPDGGMGIHYVNTSLFDATVDPLTPEALVYEPQPNGSLKLVALEYLVFEGALTGGTDERILNPDDPRIPDLFGVEMLRVPGPGEANANRYGVPAFFERHLWLYEENPAGTFADWNPNVSCP